MENTTPASGHDTGTPKARALSDLAHDACKLASLIEALDVLELNDAIEAIEKEARG